MIRINVLNMVQPKSCFFRCHLKQKASRAPPPPCRIQLTGTTLGVTRCVRLRDKSSSSSLFTAVSHVAAFCHFSCRRLRTPQTCRLSAGSFGFVWPDLAFCGLDGRYHCTVTRLWVGAVFGYTAKKWAQGLMEVGDKRSSSLPQLSNDSLSHIPPKYG